MPFAPVHLLFINLLTDSLPAIALGLEPDRSEVMSEKPRLADESILTKDFLSKIGLEGLVIGVLQIKVNRFCRKSPKKYSADSRVKMRTANRTPSKIGGSQMA